MKKMRYKIFSIIILVILGITITIKMQSYIKEQKAIAVATEYLANKYEQEMVFRRIRHYWWETNVYAVYFEVKGNDKLFFSVYVQEDLSIRQSIREFGQSSSSPDDYYLEYFDYKMNELLKPDVKGIWGDGVSARVVRGRSGMYSHYVHPDLNDKMTVEEMLPLIGEYEISVVIEYGKPDETELARRADLLFQYFQRIKESQFEPVHIAYWYTDLEEISSFRNWKEIESADEILEQLKQNDDRFKQECKIWGW